MQRLTRTLCGLFVIPWRPIPVGAARLKYGHDEGNAESDMNTFTSLIVVMN